jgi:hypothetical protein
MASQLLTSQDIGDDKDVEVRTLRAHHTQCRDGSNTSKEASYDRQSNGGVTDIAPTVGFPVARGRDG